MSLSRELRLHIDQLKEIRNILNSMKNIAFMELHKLQRYRNTQEQAVGNIERAASDFLTFHSRLIETDKNSAHYCILLGSERGFCGDFNERLIDAVTPGIYAGVIAIGTRLCNRQDAIDTEVVASLEGPNIAEETPTVINRLLEHLSTIQAESPSALQLTVLYHDSAADRLGRRQLLPPFAPLLSKTASYGTAPVLNLEPADFFAELTDHYLFAVLHEIFYISLMSENHSRLQHLEGAVSHLDEETAKLQRRSQIYRQEEITEEIEVILLNAENL